MDIRILRRSFRGTVKIPPSKSITHRAIICASLANGISKIHNVGYSDDINATIAAMENLGAFIVKLDRCVAIYPNAEKSSNNIHCNESGSTLRFVVPVALTVGDSFVFEGGESLSKRPISPFFPVFDKSDIKYTYDDKLPLKTEGMLKSGEYNIVGNVSSQFFTGLMIALAKLDSPSKIIVDGVLESKSYVDLTIDVLKSFGVEITNNDYKSFDIYPSTFQGCEFVVEGDFSQLAFFALAGIIGRFVSVWGLNFSSKQGDKKLLDILDKLHIDYEINIDEITIKSSIPQNTEIDITDTPDLGPVVFCMGAIGKGEMIVRGIERLRIKESDRVTAMVTELTKIGANITDCGDYVRIIGVETLHGECTVNSHNDHRIAMALSILCSICEKEVILENAEVVSKSYPNFYDDYRKINGRTK